MTEQEAAGPQRRVVVDVSVLLSAGYKEHPLVRACCACLEAILRICHRAVVGRELWDEWLRHQRRDTYASWWLAEMTDKGKRVIPPAIPEPLACEIRARLADAPRALKDAHLLDAAIATDCIVISRDRHAREAIARRCADMPGVRDIMWLDPEEPGIVEWLREGAPEREEWLLCRSGGGHEK